MPGRQQFRLHHPRQLQLSTSQRWKWESVGDKTLMLRNVATGQCLDSNYSGDVYTKPCDRNNKHHQWSYSHLVGTSHTTKVPTLSLKNAATRRCLGYGEKIEGGLVPVSVGGIATAKEWAGLPAAWRTNKQICLFPILKATVV
ncbi:RICIN domain-containing protein [Streptomyces sp. NPDC048442]|uniref:RICIN domain-containing protein n=1 Tax=Streptomyces sp. NPDC048442 TaxID=3154823 RepID=UPI0034235DB1